MSVTTNKVNFKLSICHLQTSYNHLLFSVPNDENWQKPTPYKWKYYIRKYVPDLSHLRLLDQGIDPDTMQPLSWSSPESKPKVNKPFTAVKSKSPPALPKKSPAAAAKKQSPAAAPTKNNDNGHPGEDPLQTVSSRKRKGPKVVLKQAAPPKRKKASPQEAKVRNIQKRASSAPGQGRVSDYFHLSTDTIADLPDLEGDDKPSAVSSPNMSSFCTCTQAPALSPIKPNNFFKVTNNGTIVILDTDTE